MLRTKTFCTLGINEAVRNYVEESITALEAAEQRLQPWVDSGRPDFTFFFAIWRFVSWEGAIADQPEK